MAMGLSGVDRLVFVYGTLRRGGSNDLARLHPGAGFVAGASVAATLYDLGAYPGAIFPAPGGQGTGAPTTPVVGEIYRITPGIEHALDILEEVAEDGRGEYVKRLVDVGTATGTVRCLAYEIHPSRIEDRPVIAGGDWLVHRLAKHRP